MKTKNIIGLKVLRENMNDYISQVEKGESFLIMRKSKPAFKITPVDEWGDEGHWKTLIDFTKIRKNGVPIGEVITALEELHERDKKISRKIGRNKAGKIPTYFEARRNRRLGGIRRQKTQGVR